MPAAAPTNEREALDQEALLEIAAGFAVAADGWRVQMASSPRTRSGLRVLAVDNYDVWILRGPPGTGVDPHDHGSSSAGFAVAMGTLKEIRWSGGVRSERLLGPGEATTIEAGEVHDVVAQDEEALSVHVYSPPLSRMAFFDEQARTVVFEEELDRDAALFVSG